MPEQTDRLLVDTIVGAENKSGRVLNLPTGNGLLTRKLDEAGVEIVGADLFPQLSEWKPASAFEPGCARARSRRGGR